MNKLFLAAALGSAAFLTGAGALAQAEPAAAASGKTDCFFNRQVNNFTARDDKTLYVKAGRDTYRMDMFGRCLDLDNAINIALDSSPSSSICSAQDVKVIVQATGIGQQRCLVKTLTKLTPQEVEALPKGDRP